jgi:hypothetical protein
MIGTIISPQIRLPSRGYRPHFHDYIIEIPAETLAPLLSTERVAILGVLQTFPSLWSTSHGASGQSFHVQLTDSPEVLRLGTLLVTDSAWCLFLVIPTSRSPSTTMR